MLYFELVCNSFLFCTFFVTHTITFCIIFCISFNCPIVVHAVSIIIIMIIIIMIIIIIIIIIINSFSTFKCFRFKSAVCISKPSSKKIKGGVLPYLVGEKSQEQEADRRLKR